MTSKFKYGSFQASLARLALAWLVMGSLAFELCTDVVITDLAINKIEITNSADGMDDSEIDEVDVDWINHTNSQPELNVSTYRHLLMPNNLLSDISFEPIPAPPPERG